MFTYCINPLFILIGDFANERQIEIEHEAINLVIKQYEKGLENRLKGTGVNPSYRSWYKNVFCNYYCWYKPRRYLVGYEAV